MDTNDEGNLTPAGGPPAGQPPAEGTPAAPDSAEGAAGSSFTATSEVGPDAAGPGQDADQAAAAGRSPTAENLPLTAPGSADAGAGRPEPVPGWERSPGAAAALSFLWPGLGQLYRGRRGRALLFAIPPVAAVLLLLYGLRRGDVVLAVQLAADQGVALVAIIVVVLLGIWRVAAVVDAYGRGNAAGGRGHVRLNRAAGIGAVAIILLSHLSVGTALVFVSVTTQKAFTTNNDLADLSTPSPSFVSTQSNTFLPSASATLGPTAAPTPAPSLSNRVTILLTGVDASAGRSEVLYDSIMVVSFDPKTNSIEMISVPRDTSGFPMYFGGNVSATTRINSIPSYVRSGWIRSPDSPYVTLEKEVAYLVGIPIDYYAVMDFAGFRKMIDTVGGIDIVNPTVIDDPTYDWLDGLPAGFHLSTGPQHLDGDQALAYVRSRHGSSDWARASRQQQIVVALLHKVAQPDQILNLPSLISTMASSVTTNFPADQVADYVAVGQGVPAANVTQIVLKPPYSAFTSNTGSSASTTCLNMPLVAGLSIQLFGKDSTWYHKKVPSSVCGSIATPTPAATAAPSPAETVPAPPAPSDSPAA